LTNHEFLLIRLAAGSWRGIIIACGAMDSQEAGHDSHRDMHFLAVTIGIVTHSSGLAGVARRQRHEQDA
jgi:hypothetical protein